MLPPAIPHQNGALLVVVDGQLQKAMVVANHQAMVVADYQAMVVADYQAMVVANHQAMVVADYQTGSLLVADCNCQIGALLVLHYLNTVAQPVTTAVLLLIIRHPQRRK